MAGRYVNIDCESLRAFVNKLNSAARDDFNKELLTFLEGIADEFLRIVEDEIIRTEAVDTRLLLNSFQKGGNGNVYILNEGDITIEVGTNVTYASYVNDGHWKNPKGVDTRWVPGDWDGRHFIYNPDSKTGMLLKQDWVKGTHYFDNAVRIIKKMIPQLLDRKVQEWTRKYFSEFI